MTKKESKQIDAILTWAVIASNRAQTRQAVEYLHSTLILSARVKSL